VDTSRDPGLWIARSIPVIPRRARSSNPPIGQLKPELLSILTSMKQVLAEPK
jgi:hypothetical protein